MNLLELLVVLKHVGVKQLDVVIVGIKVSEKVHRVAEISRQISDQVVRQVDLSHVQQILKDVIGELIDQVPLQVEEFNHFHSEEIGSFQGLKLASDDCELIKIWEKITDVVGESGDVAVSDC